MTDEALQVSGGHDEPVDKKRRRLLIAATSAVGAAGTVALVAPFVVSMSPSERAKAAGAPVAVNIDKIEPGQMLTVEWRGKPVWVVNRTPEMLELLPTLDPVLADPGSEVPQQPEYCKNPTRSIKPEYAVIIGICTHLGCSPTYRPEVAPVDLGPEWKGGFFCPCHGSRFDLAGRVYRGVPAPTNLVIPPHQYLTDTRVLVGDDGGAA